MIELLNIDLIFSAKILLSCFCGVLIGNAIGILPGLGPYPVLAILLPFLYLLGNPILAIVAMSGIYYGSAYGETLSSVLLRVPGEASSAIINEDVYSLTKEGKASDVLYLSTISSFISGLLTAFVFILFSSKLSELALMFGPWQYSIILLLGLIIPIFLTKEKTKSAAMVLTGSLFGFIGYDLTTGDNRFDFFGLLDGTGIPIMLIGVGLFGLPQIIFDYEEQRSEKIKIIGDFKIKISMLISTLKGWIIGLFTGLMPGINGITASTITYYSTKDNLDKMKGVASVEAANNSHHQSSMIPLLFLGIPTSGIGAMMLATMMSFGVIPGRSFIDSNPEMFWLIAGSMLLGNTILFFMNIKLINIWIKVLNIKRELLIGLVVFLSSFGVYTIHHSFYEVFALIPLVGLGYYFKKNNYDSGSFLVGLVVTPLLEDNLRRALMLL